MVAISRTQEDLGSLKEEVKFPSIFKRHKLRHSTTISFSRAIAIKLCRCGADVVAISRTQDDLDSLKEEVKFPSIFKRHKLRHCTISL